MTFCDGNEKMIGECQSGEVEYGCPRGCSRKSANHHRTSMPTSENKLIKEGRHVGLDIYDLLIEAIEAAAEATKLSEPSV